MTKICMNNIHEINAPGKSTSKGSADKANLKERQLFPADRSHGQSIFKNDFSQYHPADLMRAVNFRILKKDLPA